MKIKKACLNTSKKPIVVCSEKGKKISFINKRRISIEQIKIDGCQIQEGKKCDFLVRTSDNEYFIELKGSNIKHGILQLKESMRKLASKRVTRAFIVARRFPRTGASLLNQQSKFRREVGIKLELKKLNHEEKII